MMSARLTKCRDQKPSPDAKYVVLRGGSVFTAKPYGLYDPWWVVLMPEESPTVRMHDDDEWLPLDEAVELLTSPLNEPYKYGLNEREENDER